MTILVCPASALHYADTRFRFRLPPMPRLGLPRQASFTVPFTNLGLHVYLDDERSGWWIKNMATGGEALLGRVAVAWGFGSPTRPAPRNGEEDANMCAGEPVHG
ncbi:hypothetical protein [Acidocella aromatica]|uniref:Uncharacterized protein n=1 Tax=Acidocella aromatica TaxID=1303579 RepID=A0A840V953_9PROT|nr:hypothetical protein [Acidocella aromatica]MBB5372276.1 hypothetical protein [Acidocella aromatica]